MMVNNQISNMAGAERTESESVSEKRCFRKNQLNEIVLKSTEIDKSKLPGKEAFFNKWPPNIDYYDLFYFETRMRDMI